MGLGLSGLRVQGLMEKISCTTLMIICPVLSSGSFLAPEQSSHQVPSARSRFGAQVRGGGATSSQGQCFEVDGSRVPRFPFFWTLFGSTCRVITHPTI